MADQPEPPGPRAGAPTADARPMDDGSPLHEAEAAFERGDYATVRRIAGPLATGDGADGAAADLLRRTRVDPAQIGVLVGCTLFFFYIVWKYVL